MKDYSPLLKEFRKKILNLAVEHGEAHLGGCFSSADLMFVLYNEIMKPEDKFILSKGHACIPLYVLLKEKGYNPKIAGHPDIDENNGINCTTGSLGHGLPIAVGMALARKKIGKAGRIYVLMGDGECQEGTTWESALIAYHHRLNNLTTIVDQNKFQALGKVEEVISLGNLEKKFESFGWNTSRINGHCIPEIINGINKINTFGDLPKVIIADTVKGKGITYMENNQEWHAKMPNGEELKKAYEELKS